MTTRAQPVDEAMDDGSGARPALRIVLRQDRWDGLDTVREYAARWLRRRFIRSSAASASGVIDELLDIGVRLGVVTDEVIVEVYNGGGSRRYEIHVSSEMSGARARKLQTQIESIGSDPGAAYRQLVRDVAAGRGDEIALACARLCHESRVQLGLATSKDRGTIVARGRE